MTHPRSARPRYLLERLVLATSAQRSLRLAVLLCALVFLALVWRHGAPHPFLTVLGVLAALAAALLPEGNAPLVLVLFLSGLWMLTTPRAVDVATLAAAALLMLIHLASTLLAHGPPGLVLDRPIWPLWGRRLLLCLAGTAAVWFSAKVATGLDASPSRLALATALVLLLAWCAVVAIRLAWTHVVVPDGR